MKGNKFKFDANWELNSPEESSTLNLVLVRGITLSPVWMTILQAWVWRVQPPLKIWKLVPEIVEDLSLSTPLQFPSSNNAWLVGIKTLDFLFLRETKSKVSSLTI